MVGRTSDVFIETHYQDGATTPVVRSFQKMNDEIKKSQGHAKTASKEFATFGKVVGGLITVELIRKLATFTVGVTRMSTEGARSVDQFNKSWGGFQKTLGTVMSTPLSGFFQEGSKALDGFSVQIEAFGVLYHKVFGGLADTPTINRLMGIKTTPFGPKAELAQMIKDAKLEERLAGIGEQVDQQLAQERQQKKQEGEKRHQETLRLAEKRAKDFEDLAKRLGPGTVGRNMGMTGGRPSLLAALMDPSSGAAKKATDLSGQSAYISGGKTGEQLALGFKHGLQTNKQDFSNPAETMSFDIATDFRANFIGVLSQSYQDLLGGNFEDAIKGVGGGVFTSVVGGFTGELAKQTVDSEFGKKLTGFVGDGTKKAVEGIGGIVSGGLDAGLDMNRLRAIGSRAGGWLKGGVDAGFDWLMPDVSASWGPQGATFNAVKEGVSAALRGGVIGAGIGMLIGDDITRNKSAIGGAIGAMFAQQIGASTTAGAGVGALLAAIDDKLGGNDYSRTQSKNWSDFTTDIKSFGGVQGFFERIGGLKGIKVGNQDDENRNNVLFDTKHESDLLAIIRMAASATKDQAAGALAVLQAASLRQDPTALMDYSPFLAPLASEAGETEQSYASQVRNTLRALGISEEQLGNLGLVSGEMMRDTNGNYVRIGRGQAPRGKAVDPPVLPPPPPPPPPPPVLTPVQQAQALLRAAQTSGHLSASALKSLGWSGVVSQAINDVGGAWPSVGAAMRTVTNYGKGYSPQDETFIKNTLGVDIVAAQGFMGTVNRPTRFLAGEAGPEDVMIVPQAMKRGITGGGSGRGGAVLNVTMQINTPNVETTREWARREFYPMIRSMLMEDSNNGVPILRSRGVVQG